MGPRRLSKIIELIEKSGFKRAPKDVAIDKTLVSDLEKVAKSEAEAKEALDQKKLEEYLATEVAPKQEKAIQRRKELKADEIEEAIAKSQQGREFSGYKNWAEGGPTTEELRRAALQQFQEGKAEGTRDIDLSKLKTAAIAGTAIGAGTSLAPSEAEAAPQIPRKLIEQALNNAKNVSSPGGVDFNKFLQSLRKEADAWVPSNRSQLASQEILNHLILDRTGFSEGKEVDAIRRLYPETKDIPIEGNLLDLANTVKDRKRRNNLKTQTLGAYFADPLDIGKANPLKSKIAYDPKKIEKSGLAALLGHEAEHLRDDVLYPLAKHYPYVNDNYEKGKNLISVLSDKKRTLNEVDQLLAILNIKEKGQPLLPRHMEQLLETEYGKLRLYGDGETAPLLSPEEIFSSFGLKHHVSYPKNYELEKAREIVEKGIVPVKEKDQLKRMIRLDREYNDLASFLDKKAAAIGGAAIGAGMSLAPEEAEAGVRGSVLPRKLLGKKYEDALKQWTEDTNQKAREALQSVFEEDQSGLAKKEMFRRLAKEGRITWNPELQEHQIRLYRGDNPEFSEKKLYENTPTSWTPDPEVARSFAYRGKVYQTDVPLSKVGSFLNVLPGKRDYRGEKEVIIKPFKNIVKEMDKPSFSLLDIANRRMTENIPFNQLAQKKYGRELDSIPKSQIDLREDYKNLLESNPAASKFQSFANADPKMSDDDLLTYFKKTINSDDPLTVIGRMHEDWSPLFNELSPERKKFLIDNFIPKQNAKELFLKKLEKMGENIKDKDRNQIYSEKRALSSNLDGLAKFNVISKEEKNSLLDELVKSHRSEQASFLAENPDYKDLSSRAFSPENKEILFNSAESVLLGKMTDFEITPTEYANHIKQLRADFDFKDSLSKINEPIKVYALAKSFGMDSLSALDMLHDVGVPVKNHMSDLSEDDVNAIKKLWENPDFRKKYDYNWKKSSKKVAGLGGAAIGAGMLANSSSARADEGPNVSQSNPEFNSSSTTSKTVKDAISEAESKYGTYDLAKGFDKTLAGIDKYVGRPVRAAALSALKGENPLTGAIESISKDKDVEGGEIARKFLERSEESGMRLRAPVDPRLEQLRQLGVEIDGKKPEEYLPSNEFPAEAPVGMAAELILDPTNLAGMGLGTKIGKGFSKVRNFIK